MIPVATFAGKRVAVFGLGGSGRATAAALVAGGAREARTRNLEIPGSMLPHRPGMTRC